MPALSDPYAASLEHFFDLAKRKASKNCTIWASATLRWRNDQGGRF
jgi:hypothetical protein